MSTAVNVARNTIAAAVVAAAMFASTAYAQQRLSLAERVAALESRASGQSAVQGNIELLNQVQALQQQIAALQGRNEELQHQIEELKRTGKSQYIDLDSRITRLEGGSAPVAIDGSQPPVQEPLPDVSLGSQSPAASVPPAAAATNPPATSVVVAPSDPVAEKTAYDAAFGALRDGRYAESARRFQAFVDQYPQSDLASNGYYWLGESYYAAENFGVAQSTFQALLSRHPNSAKAADALLKIGYCQYETRQWTDAEATLNDVVSRYPNSQAARLAEGRLRALKLEPRS